MARPFFSPALAALFGFFLSAACLAQAPPSGRDEGAPERPAPLPGLGIKPPAPPPAVFQAGTVTVSRFRFTGLTAISAAQLEPVVAPWTGRVVSAPELAEAAKAVTEFLRAQGLFVAYAYFPDQRVVDGAVDMAIVEGRLGRVTIEIPADARLKRSVAEGMLAPLQTGSLIRRGEFDTPLLILNDVPGISVTPALLPGREPGTSDLEIGVKDEPVLGGHLRFTNHGIRELGEYELTAHLRVRNPLRIGDLATAELLTSDTGARTFATLSYSIPVSSSGTRVAAIYRNQHAKVEGDFDALGINGTWTRWTFLGTHPFVRNDERTVSGSLSYSHINYRDRIDSVGFSKDTRQRFVDGGVQIDAFDRFFGRGRSVFYIALEAGRVDLEGAAAISDATALQVNGEFHRTRLYFERVQPVLRQSELAFRVVTQFASKNLDAGRELRLGGPQGVRAYPVEELDADQGYLATLEYRHRFPLGERWSYQPAVFADRGRGDINRKPLAGSSDNTRRLSAYGLSLALNGPGWFSAAVTFAWRGRQEPVTDPDRTPRFWFIAQQGF